MIYGRDIDRKVKIFCKIDLMLPPMGAYHKTDILPAIESAEIREIINCSISSVKIFIGYANIES